MVHEYVAKERELGVLGRDLACVRAKGRAKALECRRR